MSSGSVTKASPNSSSTESLDGLKFGQKIYFEDMSLSVAAAATTTTTTQVAKTSGGVVSSSSKKGRGGGSVQASRCQVEGCKVDLSGAKAYYSRHKVCAMHSKYPTVTVAGLNQRFCQQCSRFHLLSEFDQGKRSCRRRLAGHNERRRKPPPSSILTSRYGRLSVPIFDDNGRAGGFLMEFPSYPELTLRNTTLPTPTSAEPVPGSHSATLTWQGGSDTTPSEFFLQGSGGTSFTGVTDSNCALSLLSSQTWGSRNTAPAPATSVVELNNNLLNFNGTSSMSQFAAVAASSSQVAAIHQLPWYLKGVDSGNCSAEGVPDLGLGQISPPLHGHLHGELDVSQLSRACESSHWSL